MDIGNRNFRPSALEPDDFDPLAALHPHPASFARHLLPGRRDCRRRRVPLPLGEGQGEGSVIRELASRRHAPISGGRRIGQRVAGAGLGGDAKRHVAQLDLDALDIETHVCLGVVVGQTLRYRRHHFVGQMLR